MRLNELDLVEMSLDEFVVHEMEILDNLPRTREAAEEIISYLESMDSMNAWITLLSEYEEVLTKEEYKKYTLKAAECIDEEVLKLELGED